MAHQQQTHTWRVLGSSGSRTCCVFHAPKNHRSEMNPREQREKGDARSIRWFALINDALKKFRQREQARELFTPCGQVLRALIQIFKRRKQLFWVKTSDASAVCLNFLLFFPCWRDEKRNTLSAQILEVEVVSRSASRKRFRDSKPIGIKIL